MWFFFFSSRRRHTRLTCDWSSDVCSSDLHAGLPHRDDHGRGRDVHRRLAGLRARCGGRPGLRGRRPARQEHDQLERSEEHTSELQSHVNLVCRLLLEKKKKKKITYDEQL